MSSVLGHIGIVTLYIHASGFSIAFREGVSGLFADVKVESCHILRTIEQDIDIVIFFHHAIGHISHFLAVGFLIHILLHLSIIEGMV